MLDENGVWQVIVGPDGKEQVTVGTPEFPVQIWGPWADAGKAACLVPWHWHDEIEIEVVTDGEEVVTADGKSFHLKPGQGIFISSGVMHGSETVLEKDGVYHHDSLLFAPSVVGGASGSVFWQKYLGPLAAAPECRCIPLLGEQPWERQVLALAQQAVDLWETKQPGYEFGVRAALSQIIFYIKENCVHHAKAPSERELRDAGRIKQMVDFIRTHCAEPITTGQIAASAAISVSECLRCFRRMMDLTPKEYLRQHRIRHAANLLEQTGRSIAAIGEECGFEDMSYFARVFREEKGCTPSEYREKTKQ